MSELTRVGLGPRPYARWSDASDQASLPEHALIWLTSRLGRLTPATVVPENTVAVSRGDLPVPARKELAAVVGDEHVDETPHTRRMHAGGQSYLDLVRRRSGAHLQLPDAVVRPATHEEVVELLAVCHAHRIAVVPFGGGTSVVGGVEPRRGRHYAVITLNLSRMDELVDVDEGSQTATFQPGVTGPQAEELLQPHGLTIGHVPQSFARASLGGYVATRSAGQASTGYGRMDDLVVELAAATPTGAVRVGTGTPNAAGPDLRSLFVGSEGAFGVLTEITLRVRPAPAERHYEMWALPTFAGGLACLRTIAQRGSAPDVVRLSDETETTVTRAMRARGDRQLRWWLRLHGQREPVFLLLGWEGTGSSIRSRRAATTEVVREHDGVRLGTKAGEAWRAQRFAGPHQRDALLDAGVMVETLETATTWSRLETLYSGVRVALEAELARLRTPPVIMSHVSHLYPTGASLYFTVLARQLPPPADALEQWTRAKAAASAAIVDLGGTISHHHAVGRDHANDLGSEIGDIGLRALAAVKAELDPRNIMNPGALVDPRR